MKTPLNVFYIKKLKSYLSKGGAESCLVMADAGPFHGTTKKKKRYISIMLWNNQETLNTKQLTFLVTFCRFSHLKSQEKKSFKNTSTGFALFLLTFEVTLSTCLKLLGLCYCLQEFLNYYTVIISSITASRDWIELVLKQQLYTAYKIHPPKQPFGQLTIQEWQKNSEAIEVRINLNTHIWLQVTFPSNKKNSNFVKAWLD